MRKNTRQKRAFDFLLPRLVYGRTKAVCTVIWNLIEMIFCELGYAKMTYKTEISNFESTHLYIM